jgi:tRNA-specific 2-thiouridylase
MKDRTETIINGHSNTKKRKILVGMSGGVDSTVAAFILMSKGFQVEGLYFRNGFPGKGYQSAQQAADQLHIPLHVIDVSHTFCKEVADYFISEYRSGRTPNPCVVCNKKVKFKVLLDEAKKRGFDYVATGHYARIEYNGNQNTFKLLKGIDNSKDQSYFLFLLDQRELAHIIFPNGDKTKKEIRKLATKMGLESRYQKESQEICFIPDNDYKAFIENYDRTYRPVPGCIVDKQGHILGKHKGIFSYTIGQRRGLNIASTRPYYVVGIDALKNEVIVGRQEEQGFQGLIAKNVCWTSPDIIAERGVLAITKIRYRHSGVESIIKPLSVSFTCMPDIPANNPGEDYRLVVFFKEPQNAVAPGQAAVFYQEDYVIGGGWIEKSLDVK